MSERDEANTTEAVLLVIGCSIGGFTITIVVVYALDLILKGCGVPTGFASIFQ